MQQFNEILTTQTSGVITPATSPRTINGATLNPEPPTRRRSIWSAREVQLLVKLRREDGLGWAQVATYFRRKTANACRKRYERFNRGVRGTGPMPEGENRVSSLRDGASWNGARVQIQRTFGEFMEKIIQISEDVQIPDNIAGFTAVNATQNVCSILHIKA